MDKLEYFVERTTNAIKSSVECLNELSANDQLEDDGGVAFEKSQVFESSEGGGNEVNGELYDRYMALCVYCMRHQQFNTHRLTNLSIFILKPKYSSEEEDPEETDDEVVLGVGDQVLAFWQKRKQKLQSSLATAGWLLSVKDEVRADVAARKSGGHHDAMEEVITKMYSHDVNADVPELIDTFWNEYKHFQNKTGPFSNKARWASKDAINGNSDLWHEKYSLPHTEVLGLVACRVTSKNLGIGAAERSWGGVKDIKFGKRSHLSTKNTEMQSILYTSARIQEARAKQSALEQVDARGRDAMWGDDDEAFELELTNFGVDTTQLMEEVPRRLFHVWVEDWELELLKKKCPVAEAMLLEKYKGELVFLSIFYVCIMRNI